jgi:hypothetical protein
LPIEVDGGQWLLAVAVEDKSWYQQVGQKRGSMAMCGCIGGSWVQMVAAGEIGKARRQGGHCYFLGWAMFLGSGVRRQSAFSKLFLLSILTVENTQDHSILTEDKNLHVCRLFVFRLQLITIYVGM